MKKIKTTPSVFLLIFIAFSPLFGQKAMKINNSCNFATDEKEGILYTYDPSKEATIIIEKIMKANVLPQNFIIKSADCKNALATTDGKERYILYSTTFLESFKKDAQTAWAAYCVLAHEIGHHLSNHNLEETDLLKRKLFELEADKFAGAALFRLGANLLEAQAGIKTFALEGDSKTHPSAKARLEAIAVGWKQAKELEENKETMKGELRLVSALDKQKSKEIVANGKKLSLKKKYEEAIEQFEKATELDPNNAEAYYEWAKQLDGFSYQSLKEANELLDKALELNPTLAEAYYEKANVYKDANKLMVDIGQTDSLSITLLDKAIELNPNFMEAYSRRSSVYQDMGKGKQSSADYNLKALSDINKTIALEKNETERYDYYMRRGNIFKLLKRYDEAAADYERYNALKTDDIFAQGKEVCTLFDMNRLEKALVKAQLYVEKACKKNSNKGYHKSFSTIQRDVIECYYIYLTQHPAEAAKISEAYYQKASQERDIVLAINYLQEAVFIQPSIKTHLKLGVLMLEEDPEAFSEAKLYFSKILELQPGNHEALYWYSRFEIWNTRDFEPILRQFDDKIDLFPNTAAYLMSKGYVALGAQGLLESIPIFDKALTLNPKADTAWSGKSQAYYELGLYKEAIDCANKALVLNPKANTHKQKAEAALQENATADKKQLATSWFEKGEKAFHKITAIEWYKRAIELNPNFVEAYLKLTEAYKDIDKENIALDCWAKIIEVQPQNFEAYKKRVKLQERLKIAKDIIINQLDVAAQKSPITAELFVLKGEILMEENDTKQALDSFEKAIAKNPKLEMAYTAKGCLLVKLERYKEALELLSEALKLNPKSQAAKDCRQEALKKL
jgi:tetratricopeptide (TPR) repeat protein